MATQHEHSIADMYHLCVPRLFAEYLENQTFAHTAFISSNLSVGVTGFLVLPLSLMTVPALQKMWNRRFSAVSISILSNLTHHVTYDSLRQKNKTLGHLESMFREIVDVRGILQHKKQPEVVFISLKSNQL